MRGFIVFEGASLFDKKPIVGIVTLNSSNAKTGNIAQLWILRSDISPVDAVKNGADQSVCGGCQHRHYKKGACYVLPFQGPRAVYDNYRRGGYSSDINEGLARLAGLGLRLGAYGDPAMLPDNTLQSLVHSARFHTGYTHQWKNKKLTHALKYCQGSVDNVEEIAQLHKIDPSAKHFRVSHTNDLFDNEIECLNTTQNLSCAECKICDGSQKNIVVKIHGSLSKRFSEKSIKVFNV
jgi:hypothetical protein